MFVKLILTLILTRVLHVVFGEILVFALLEKSKQKINNFLKAGGR